MDNEILQKLRKIALARNNQAVSGQAKIGEPVTAPVIIPDNRVAEENRKRLEL